MTLVGLAGYMGSGKTICAKHLQEKGYTRIAFADSLKELCVSLDWDGTKDKKGRRLLQQIGQALRNYDSKYWVNKWLERYYTVKRLGIEHVVCDDVRYPNEVECIRRLGGCIIRIDRFCRWPWWPKHQSERKISADFVIKNNKDIDHLYKELDKRCVIL